MHGWLSSYTKEFFFSSEHCMQSNPLNPSKSDPPPFPCQEARQISAQKARENSKTSTIWFPSFLLFIPSPFFLASSIRNKQTKKYRETLKKKPVINPSIWLLNPRKLHFIFSMLKLHGRCSLLLESRSVMLMSTPVFSPSTTSFSNIFRSTVFLFSVNLFPLRAL